MHDGRREIGIDIPHGNHNANGTDRKKNVSKKQSEKTKRRSLAKNMAAGFVQETKHMISTQRSIYRSGLG